MRYTPLLFYSAYLRTKDCSSGFDPHGRWEIRWNTFLWETRPLPLRVPPSWWATWKRGAASSENRWIHTKAARLRWQVYHGSCAARNWAGPQRGKTRAGSSRLSAMRHSPGAQPGETRYRSWTQRDWTTRKWDKSFFFFFLLFLFRTQPKHQRHHCFKQLSFLWQVTFSSPTPIHFISDNGTYIMYIDLYYFKNSFYYYYYCFFFLFYIAWSNLCQALPNLRRIFASFRTEEEEREYSRTAVSGAIFWLFSAFTMLTNWLQFFNLIGFLGTCVVFSLIAQKISGSKSITAY